jgi:hypothetical protein
MPLSRFIGGYANHRSNPFTGDDMAVSKTEDHVSVPTSSPFCLQLIEVPRKDSPSSVVIFNYSDGTTVAEVVTSPTLGQFRVDYPSPDGQGTGLLEFNSGDAGKDIRIVYMATGSPIVAEFLDGFVRWPSPTPGENQGVIFKSGAPAWAYFPKRYFHEGNALHHPAGENESCVLFRFKKGANDTKVYLDLKGTKVHQGFYSELAPHNHQGSTGQGGEHTHPIPSHAHPVGERSLTGTQPRHSHTYVDLHPEEGYDVDNLVTGEGGDDQVSVQFTSTNTEGSGELQTDSSETHAHDIPDAGGNEKTYPDRLQIYIDGVDKTANVLALSGLAMLGDGTAGHGFVTSGTGEIEIAALLGSGSMHEIKITEPISGKGGRTLIHLEVY